MVLAQPVVGVQEGDQVVALLDGALGAGVAGCVAEVRVIAVEDAMVRVPSPEFRIGPAVGDQEMPARVALGQDAVVGLPQDLQRLAVVGRHDRDTGGHQVTRKPSRS